MRKLPLAITLVCALVAAAPDVRAAPEGEEGAAAAETLFQEARKLADDKRYAEACPKFAASQKAAPAIGTLLNLADCYEKNNQLASAWSRFREAIALAQRLGRANREQTARERADRLEPRLIKLVILSHGTSDVKLDGAFLDPAVLGTPLPIDAGKHTIEAVAKGKKPYSTTLDANERAKNQAVTIPELEDDGTAALVPATAKEPNESKPAMKKEEPKRESSHDGSTQKILGVVSASAGLVGIGIGAFMGAKTSSTWKDAQSHCTGLECDQQGLDLAGDAKTSGDIATVSFIAGGALLLGGAVLYLTAPTGRRTDPARQALRFGAGPTGIVVGGTFQ